MEMMPHDIPGMVDKLYAASDECLHALFDKMLSSVEEVIPNPTIDLPAP